MSDDSVSQNSVCPHCHHVLPPDARLEKIRAWIQAHFNPAYDIDDVGAATENELAKEMFAILGGN